MFFMLVRGQVPRTIYLSLYNFYLSRTIAQSLMSSPGMYIEVAETKYMYIHVHLVMDGALCKMDT